VLVTAKAPRPGWTKTRLCPPLGLELAARVGHALIADSLAAARAADPDAGLLAPAGDVEVLAELFPDCTVVAQRGDGLASALQGAVRDGHLLLSGDAPDYPPHLVEQALRSTADLVLGPSLDGGYCLIGMNRFHPAPFRDIPWSTGAVLRQTLAAAQEAGLSVDLLDAHHDVDHVGDLLLVDLSRATATAALLRRPDVAPFAPRAVPAVTERRVVHDSPWRRVVAEQLETGAGYRYLETPAAVWVVPVSEEGETMFVRQYRHPVRAHPLEMPAGSIEPGEAPVQAAARELHEEVGGVARHLRPAGGFYSSSAHISLQGLVFLATGVRFEQPTHARSERIELVRMPFSQAVDLARKGELCEAQSALAILLAARLLEDHRTGG
jgi:glycosyltransferase A (GT-A) superfamily protein (DUF2064 family)/8-oxo-dGTP pyrophosphatase MutT (NUDIX family)